MGSHSITCHPGRGDIPAFTPAEAGTWLSDLGGRQGWVDLVGWLQPEMVYPPEDGHPSQLFNLPSFPLPHIPLGCEGVERKGDCPVLHAYTVNGVWLPIVLNTVCVESSETPQHFASDHYIQSLLTWYARSLMLRVNIAALFSSLAMSTIECSAACLHLPLKNSNNNFQSSLRE